MLHLWARVPGDNVRLAAAELRTHVGPQSVNVQASSGRVCFTVPFTACDTPESASQLARNVSKLRTVEHVYATLVEGSLQRQKLRKAVLTEGSDVQHHSDPADTEAATALASIRAAAAGVPSQRVAAALRLRRAMASLREDGTPPPEPDTAVRVHVVGKRGGKHGFSSDDAKRAAAEGLRSSGTVSLGCRQSDATAFVHVHFGAWWLGLQMNHATLLDHSFLKKTRAQLLRELQGQGEEEAGLESVERGECDSGSEEAWVGAFCSRAAAVASSQAARQRQSLSESIQPPKSGDEVAAPLGHMPYAQQLDAKAAELKQLLLRAARRLRKQYATDFPDWLEPRIDAPLYCEWGGVEPSPQSEGGWLNYVELVVGCDRASRPVLGFRAPSTEKARAAEVSQGAVLSVVGCRALPEAALQAVQRFRAAVEE
eukprot:Hpha_TRINITY_DN23502_c0_g1::TRINITY_DN23502_c0_g1_i1::g.186409::m.186409